MKRLRHVSLRPLTTFGVDASANHLVQLESMQDIDELPNGAFSPERDLVLGGGSNILFTSDPGRKSFLCFAPITCKGLWF